MWKLNISCTRFKVIIIVVHVGNSTMKIYVAIVEAFRKKERQGQN
jgi:hypothetical protein